MDLKIVAETKNGFFERKEISFEVASDKGTPSRKDVKAKLAALANAQEDQVLIKEIRNRFGGKIFFGSAFVYPSNEKLKKAHRVFYLKRDKMLSEEELKKIEEAKIRAKQAVPEKK